MTDLYFRKGEPPATLPEVGYTLTDPPEARTDLANHPHSREECGYLLAPAQPEYDSATQGVRWDVEGEEWQVFDLPPAPPPPPPVPQTLGKLEFLLLCQMVGGMTDDMLVAAQENPAFKAFWIKYQMAQAVERDSEVTAQALAALEGGGYLPNGAQAIVDNWPTQ